MTIDEGIEGLENLKLYPWPCGQVPWLESIELGIEALKRIKVFRSANQTWLSLLLLGETKE